MSIAYYFQIAGLFLVPFIAVLLPLLIGQRLGDAGRKKSDKVPHIQINSVVVSAFGLLTLMIAFTFQIATSRYESRKQLLMDEVTKIRTTFLRAGLIPEPFRTNTKSMLIEYVDGRLQIVYDLDALGRLLNRSQQILDTLWKYSEILAEQDRSSEAYALFIISVNEMIDTQNQRLTVALQYRIPRAVIITLFIIEIFSMLVLGYQFGMSGKRNSRLNMVLALIFSIVIFLILVLDRPELGLARLNQKPMQTLHEQMHGKLLDVNSLVP